MAAELAEAVEKELKERELEEKAEAAAAAGTTTTTTATETTTETKPEAILENVDQSLFTGDDLPDDFSDEDEGK